MILGDFSDGNSVEFLVVHVFDDEFGIFDSYDDTDMSVVRIVSISFELDDRSHCRGFTSWYSLCFCISYPLVCISSPGDCLVLCDIGGTVSPGKSSAQSGIDYLIGFISFLSSSACLKKTLGFFYRWFFIGNLWGYFLGNFDYWFYRRFFSNFQRLTFLLILFILSYQTDWLTRTCNNNHFANWKLSLKKFSIIRENA